MILREFVIFATFLLELGSSASVKPRERHGMTLLECAAIGGECDESKGRQFCGTDNQTYPSKCHLIRAQCSGHEVSIRHPGTCRTCKVARDYALKHRATSSTYIPRCKSDGTYAPVQCMKGARCWCSSPVGIPLNNSSSGTSILKCRAINRPNRRRSPVRHPISAKNRKPCTKSERVDFISKLIKHYENEYNRSGSEMPANDKVVISWKFTTLDANHNQILDKSEFRELKKLVKRAVKPAKCARTFGKICDIDSNNELTLSEWSSCLSTQNKLRGNHDINNNNNNNKNGNHILHGHENTTGSIRRIDNFHYNNNNKEIYNNNKENNNNNKNSNNNSNNSNNSNNNGESNRFSFNLNHLNGHDPNLHNLFHSNINYINTKLNNNSQNNININTHNNSNNNNHNDNDDQMENHSLINKLINEHLLENEESSQSMDYEDGDYEDENEDIDISMRKLFGSSTNFPSIYYLKAKPEQPKEETETDCLTDRENFLENQNNGGSAIYLPECTKDGRYQKVQCYKSTPYCWCVNEDNGHPIPGTSVKDKKPHCDSIQMPSRIMKKCPEPKKSKFLRDLKDFLKAKYKVSSSDTKSDDERAVRLVFSDFDKDSSLIWERKEWKFFRDIAIGSRNLKKCGKRFPRFCDSNGDKVVTLTEWLSCLQIRSVETASLPTTTNSSESVTRASKLIGLNPLEQYLKE